MCQFWRQRNNFVKVKLSRIKPTTIFLDSFWQQMSLIMVFNGSSPEFFIYFHLFKQTLQFTQQIYLESVHPVYGPGIRTHDLRPKKFKKYQMSCDKQPMAEKFFNFCSGRFIALILLIQCLMFILTILLIFLPWYFHLIFFDWDEI